MARFGRSYPSRRPAGQFFPAEATSPASVTVHGQAAVAARTVTTGTVAAVQVVNVSVTGQAAVLPRTTITGTVSTGSVSATVHGQTTVLPAARTTGNVNAAASVTVTGHAAVLPRTVTAGTIAVAGGPVSIAINGQAAVTARADSYGNLTVTVPSSVVAPEGSNAYLTRYRTFRAVTDIITPVAAAPATVEYASIYQVSESYGQPTVIAGLPYADSARNPWQPTAVTRQVWATQMQIVVGGQDVTFFRGAPTVIGTWTSQEPFADAAATFTLPAVTTFDQLPAPAALPAGEVVAICGSYTGHGYWQASAEGLVSSYGDAAYLGDPLGLLNEPVTGIASHPGGYGYALCAADGGVFCFGNVTFHGNATGLISAPCVGIALTATGNGYWLLTADGSIFAFGDAVTHGNASVGYPTNQATGIARSAGGAGYVIVANNGGVFCLGDATFHGNGIGSYVADYTAVATLPGTDGYLLVNKLGDAYAYGAITYNGGVNVPLAQPVNSAALTATGNGYWMSAGDGGVFTYGDAPFYGSIPGGGTVDWGSLSWLRMGTPVTINRIDSAGTAHTLWEGVVADWEDATAPGNVGLQVQCVGCLFQLDWYIAKPVVDLPFIGFNPDTNLPIFGWDIGHALAQAINSVTNPSAGTALGSGPQPPSQGSPFNGNLCTPVDTGILTVTRGNWDQLASGYMQNMLAQAQAVGGYQWTVGLQRPRTPVIVEKNLTTTNWTVTAGARGVATQLSFDQSTAATAIYGQGQAPPVLAAPGVGQSLTGAWQGTKYPQTPSTVPAFPLSSGAVFSPGGSATGMRPFTDWMRQSGTPLASQDTYLASDPAAAVFDQYLIESFQQDAGLQVTGLVDQATWDAAFGTGINENAIANVFYAPLWQLPQVEPYTYTPSGGIVGNNPYFNPRVPRIERFEQMGQQLTKAQGVVSARIEGARIQTPAWTGTITLTADPQEGSRFDMQAGQNLLVKSFRGRDTLFHISAVSVDFSSLSVQLTVSTQGTDMMTLAAIYSRDSQAHGVARVGRPSLVSLNVASNTTVFDSESGAGRIPPTSINGSAANPWVVLRVPFSEAGSVALVDLTSSPATPFAVGVFSAPVTPDQLLGVFGTNGPLTADAAGNNPWNDYATTGANGGPGLDNLGLLYGAGGPNGACGYWPSDPNGTQTLTGRYLDGQTWPYASAPGYVPWVWVALWAATSCTVSGRFLMAPAA